MNSVEVARHGPTFQNSPHLKRSVACLLLILLSLILFEKTFVSLLNLALQSERYTHIILIPVISLCLIFWDRRSIFRKTSYCPRIGLPLIILGIVSYYSAATAGSPLQITATAVILTWTAGFILCYGTNAWLAARFPLLFLLLMIPLSSNFMDSASATLQYGSAEVTAVLFGLSGIPVFRQGFTFALPGVSIEIAEECSGIRSSIAFVITSLLAGHIFLQSKWNKLILVLLTIPITIFKNAVRIVVLAGLGVYVDRDFLHGDLHHSGGSLFSLIGLAIFLPLLGLLYKSEARTLSPSNQTTDPTT